MFVARNEEIDKNMILFLYKMKDLYISELENTTKRLQDGHEKYNNFILAYLAQLLSKLMSIIVLLENKQYDSVFIVARSFLENYALLSKITKVYGTEEFEVFMKQVIISDMVQNKKILVATQETAEGYYEKWKKYLNNYLEVECDETDYISIIDRYIREQAINTIHITDLVAKSLKENNYLNMYNDDKFVYPYLCSISHSNLSAIDDRCNSGDLGLFGININCFNLEQTINTVGYCMKDLIEKIKDRVR